MCLLFLKLDGERCIWSAKEESSAVGPLPVLKTHYLLHEVKHLRINLNN